MTKRNNRPRLKELEQKDKNIAVEAIKTQPSMILGVSKLSKLAIDQEICLNFNSFYELKRLEGLPSNI